MNCRTDIVVIAHDIRSTHNVGSLLRTCEGLSVSRIYFSGYTPYPKQLSEDTRLPHIAQKLDQQIHKTALGAEQMVPWEYCDSIAALITSLQLDGYWVVALEQSVGSIPLPSLRAGNKVALLLGREVEGIAADVLALCNETTEIPMFGRKESFNVVQAAAMALYQIRFSES